MQIRKLFKFKKIGHFLFILVIGLSIFSYFWRKQHTIVPIEYEKNINAPTMMAGKYIEYATPVDILISKSQFDKVDYLVSKGAKFSQEYYKTNLIKYIQQVDKADNLTKIVHFGYPRLFGDPTPFRMSDWEADIPNIYPDITNYFIYDPIDAYTTTLQVYLSLYNKFNLDKNKLFLGLENYIIALLNTDFNWKVNLNKQPETYNSYSEFIFDNTDIEQKGFRRRNPVEERCGNSLYYRDSSLGCENKIDKRTHSEYQIYTLSKFFHRRGELFSMSTSYFILHILAFEKNKNVVAKRLYYIYGEKLQTRYNNFAIRWNSGILPVYPYYKFKGKEAQWSWSVTILCWSPIIRHEILIS